jgi:hypothetical protein
MVFVVSSERIAKECSRYPRCGASTWDGGLLLMAWLAERG